MTVIFFDIGDTLATPTFDEDDHLIGFNVFPDALEALEELRRLSFRLGVISNRGGESPETVNRALEECGLLRFFDPAIVLFRRKDSPAVFTEAAARAGVASAECVFVGENKNERALASKAGFRVAPHPKLALPIAEGETLVYARIPLAAETQAGGPLLEVPLVPLRIAGGEPRRMYAITTPKAVEQLRRASFGVEIVGAEGAPLLTDLYLVRDDRQPPAGLTPAEDISAGFLKEQGQSALILARAEEGVYLALPADRSVEEIHFPGALHGHNEKLVPDMSLLAPFSRAAAVSEPTGLTAAATLQTPLSPEELEALGTIDASTIRRHHGPYVGDAPLTPAAGQAVASRHVRHPDNGRVTEALRDHLKAVGGAEIVVRRQRFQHENLFLFNVEAELAGTDDPASHVLVTAHLDSTAAFDSEPYDPAADPAPGADDDASGVAAVIAIAAALAGLHAARRPRRTIRFVLFNAEEHGLVGSKAYARAQAAQGARIDAVFQMDMIGFGRAQASAPREFEVHAGFPPSDEVEQRSLALARLVLEAAAGVSPALNAPQVYPARQNGDDPAAGRSDHAAFQERGYAACAVSEDFFVGPGPDSPAPNPNPDYHRRTDRRIDFEYAADIARAVAAAAWLAARA
jgi:hypothetical protein